MRVTASEPVAFEPAVAVVRPLPKWMPPRRTIHPAYDPVVLAAAREWLFQPARQNGRPVKSEVMVDIELLPPAGN